MNSVVQSSGIRRPRSEKGLLTPDNCVVAMIDLQPQMLFGVGNFDRQSIINNNLILAKAARVCSTFRSFCPRSKPGRSVEKCGRRSGRSFRATSLSNAPA